MRSSTQTRPPCIAHVLVDERQAEPGTVAAAAPAGDAAAGEALEHQLALLDGHAGAVVLDGDPHVTERLALAVRSTTYRSGSPPPCTRALSIRLATTRARRRRSPRMTIASARSLTTTACSAGC